MQAFACVLFQMKPRDADFFAAACGWNFDESVFGERLVILRKLVALGGVGIEIIFSSEDRSFVDSAVQRHGSLRGELYCLLVQHWQCSRQTQAYWADVGVG